MIKRDHNPSEAPHALDPQEQVVVRRLAKLNTLPVETGRLDAAIRQAIPQTPAVSVAAGRWRRLASVRWAAGVLLAIGVAAVVATLLLTGPAAASAAELASAHRQLTAGDDAHVVRVDSMHAAEALLADQLADKATLPQRPPSGHAVMACCIHRVGRTPMGFVVLGGDAGPPVTLAVCDAADMKAPPGSRTVSRDGRRYAVQSADGVNMVMARRSGQWVCLMSESSVDTLLDLASQMGR